MSEVVPLLSCVAFMALTGTLHMYIFYFFGCIKKNLSKLKTLCNMFKNAHFCMVSCSPSQP